MPRVDTTPNRRTKRDGKQKQKGTLARTAASVRAAAMAAASVSAPIVVKREPVAATIPAAVAPSPPRGWRHPDELPYIRNAGKVWDDMTIIRFLAANALTIPPRGTNTIDPWVHVRSGAGHEVILPRGYRLPLLWVAKYQWTSVKLVLTAEPAIRKSEWDGAKFEILHIARLCAGLLAKARAQMDEGGMMERGWRCAQFDRALWRYWHDWLIMRDEFVRDFWREFGEEEYQGDVLKLAWSRWVLKGHKGFTLTTREVADGISADGFMQGLVIDDDAGQFEWRQQLDTASPESNNVPADIPVSVVIPTPQPQNNNVVELPAPIAVGLTQTQSDNVVELLPAPASTPASSESRVLSFLIRPRNAFRAPSEANFVPTSPVDSISPSWAVDGFVRQNPPQEVRSDGIPNSVGLERQNAPNENGNDAQMQVDARPRTPSVGLPAVATKMGSLAPGLAVLRGHSVDDGVNTRDRPPSESEHQEEEEEDAEMPGVVTDTARVKAEPATFTIPARDRDSLLDDLDFDSDLELLYPDQPDSPSQSPGPAGAGARATSPNHSSRRSDSGSASPVPPLSSASFLSDDTNTSNTSFVPATSTQMTVYPHPHPHPPPPDAAPQTVGMEMEMGRFLGMLGEEVRALRTEVAQLRGELGHVHPVMQQPHVSLDERVRRLEEGAAAAPPPLPPPRRIGMPGGGSGWVHPLQHLMVGMGMDVDEEEANSGTSVSPAVDEPTSGMGMGMGMARYGSFNGEPLPPRSRRFNGNGAGRASDV
ncbi:hypothetical protein C8R46DRAFT_1193083 [Mycena filopes]|nr:hypothetical protein C8R46DRAFT_1193083 [Mycena filopes]